MERDYLQERVLIGPFYDSIISLALLQFVKVFPVLVAQNNMNMQEFSFAFVSLFVTPLSLLKSLCRTALLSCGSASPL